MISIKPVSATTLAFTTEGNIKKDGQLTGQLVFSNEALAEAVSETSNKQGLGEPIPLSQIKGAEFTFKYVSPYSGVEHNQETLCKKRVYDITEFRDNVTDFQENPLQGVREPTLVLSAGGGIPEFIDFSSCIGESGSVSSKISSLDDSVVSSTLDSLFGKLTVFDKDVMGFVVYRSVKPIKFALKP